MEIIEMLAPKGSKCRPGRKLNGFMGVTIHNTGNASKGADALAHARYLQGSGQNTAASWHYCVDGNRATRSIPEDEIAWHAGDGSGNGNYKTIAIEICMNADGNIQKATDNAVSLAADILSRHGVFEGKGHLFEHNHWSGKNCPQKIREGIPYDWDTFCGKVEACLKEEENMKMEDVTVKVGKVEVPAKLIDDTTYVAIRPFVQAIKEGLEVTWTLEDGAGVKL